MKLFMREPLGFTELLESFTGTIMVHRFLYALFILFFAASLAGADDGRKSRLLVRGDHNYPPYEFLDEDGSAMGFNIDMVRAVTEVMGLEIEIRLGPWNEVRKDLEAGWIDAITGMYYSKEVLFCGCRDLLPCCN